jgi:hypothetical protein
MIAVTVAAMSVIAGVVCAAQLNGRIAERNAVLERSEPFAYAAQNLYAALSAADAAAASEFLSVNGTAPVRKHYQKALADAASALTDVTAGATDPATRKAVAQLTAQLTAYTGMVESARANNRQTFVVGAGYLREASWLMQNTMLPAAERIFTDDLAAVGDDQRGVGSAPMVGFILLGLVLAATGIGSAVVYARTNRQFNVGLIVAATSVVLVGGAILIATGSAARAIDESSREAAEFGRLAKARIFAQQARTDETLGLIAHGDITAYETSFDAHIQGLVTLLGTERSPTMIAVEDWRTSHRKQVELYQNSDYNGAVTQAIGSDPHASATQFAIVESSVRDQIEGTRVALRDDVSAAGVWLVWSPTVTLVLMGLAAGAAVAGLWPRLKEFL